MDDKTQLRAQITIGPGTRLNDIVQIDHEIASGGMGQIFRGHIIMTGEPVAIKVVLPQFSRDETILALFRKEAGSLLRLRHDAIVPYRYSGTDPVFQRPYLVMDFIEGITLKDHLVSGPLTLGEILTLGQRVSSGLAAAHRAGIVHRDVAPDNILLEANRPDLPKIIDFGIARMTEDGAKTLLGNQFAGKNDFASPEQCGLYGGDVRDASDIYSLGLVLAAASLGKPLDMSGSQFDIIEKRRSVPNLDGIPTQLHPLLRQMLEPDPAKRQLSMGDVAAFCGGEPLPRFLAAEEAPGGGEADLQPVPKLIVEQAPTEHKAAVMDPVIAPTRRSRIAIMAIGALSLLVIASAAYIWGFQRQVSEPSLPLQQAQTKPDVPEAEKDIAVAASAPSEQEKQGQIVETAARAVTPPSAPQTEPAQQAIHEPSDHIDQLAEEMRKRQEELTKSLPKELAEPVPSKKETPANSPSPEVQQEPKVAASSAATNPTEHESMTASPPAPLLSPPAAPLPEPSSAPALLPPDKEPDTQIASLPPAAGSTVQPSLASDPREVWLNAFDGGDCFFARLSRSEGNDVEVTALSSDDKSFFALDGAFTKAFGFEAKIRGRPVSTSQCRVTNFMNALSKLHLGQVDMMIHPEKIENGKAITGDLSSLTKSNLVLLLADTNGVIYNVTNLASRTGAKAQFSAQLSYNQPTAKEAFNIVIALTSDRPIKLSGLDHAASADAIFPQILELAKQNGDLGFGYAFFTITRGG